MYCQERHLVAKSGTKLGPVKLSSDVPPVEASSGQSGTQLGLVDLSTDEPPW